MQIGKYNYNRVSRQMPCPVCQRDKYCLVSDDGLWAICTKVNSKKEYKTYHGWLHPLGQVQYLSPKKIVKSIEYSRDIEYIRNFYKKTIFRYGAVIPLAEALNVSAQVLMDMGVGMDGCHWCFPMFDGNKKLIGIKRRNGASQKWCEKGSRLGVYLHQSFDASFSSYITEGESDTAAMLTKGYNTVGRASESSCKEILKKLLINCPEVNIVPDNDPHGSGWRYARQLAEYLKQPGRKVNIYFHRGHKDIREWINSGTFTDKKFQKLKKET